MKRNLIWLFCILSSLLQAQTTISGVVLNAEDNKPIEFASVYINGSTNGTYTDFNGAFRIENVSTPCQLIISHIQFDVKQILIQSNISEKLIIHLNEKSSVLSSIDVVGKSTRAQVINEFKNIFLGNDIWGRKAVLKNENVLRFSNRVDSIDSSNSYLWQKFIQLKKLNEQFKNNPFTPTEFQVLSAKSESPLLIELPLLGYDVYVDLVSFDIRTFDDWKECNYWAYYRFVPYTLVSELQKKNYEKTRQTVYYNSSKHFCQSLFDNKLKENGYLISFSNKKDSTNYIDLANYIQRVDSTEIKIIGLKNQEIRIDYFEKKNNVPIDLTVSSYNPSDEKNVWKNWDLDNTSSVIFKSDTCTIRYNGTIPDTNILFDGKIASKRGGALLPSNYIPKKIGENKPQKKQ